MDKVHGARFSIYPCSLKIKIFFYIYLTGKIRKKKQRQEKII